MPWERIEVNNQIKITAFYTLFEQHLPCGWNFDGESHDFWECVYIIKGDIFATGDERVYNLTQGEMIFHEPMEFHRLWVDNKDGADVVIFSISAEGKLLDFFRDKVLFLSEKEQSILSEMLEFVRKEHINKSLKNEPLMFRNLAPLGKNNGYLQSVASYIGLLFLSLWGSQNTAKAEDTAETKVLYACVRFMKSNISKKITIDELASRSKISTSTLKRIFIKYTGISVHRYIINLKTNMATELLQSGKNVTEVADTLGFSSQAHFSKSYKNMTGKNPSEVKR